MEEPEAYESYGNGSAMRVSATGWLYDSLERTREVARATAEVTHNHPEAITAFLEGKSFEDVIRTAVSQGGDCDTLTAIAGSIAEAFYGIPADIQQVVDKMLPEEFLEVIHAFETLKLNS